MQKRRAINTSTAALVLALGLVGVGCGESDGAGLSVGILDSKGGAGDAIEAADARLYDAAAADAALQDAGPQDVGSHDVGFHDVGFHDVEGWHPDLGADLGEPEDLPPVADIPVDDSEAPDAFVPDVAADASLTDSGTAADTSTGEVETGGPVGHPFSCEDPPPLPVSFHILQGFSGSEDFAFDHQGNLVSANNGGNLTRQPHEGKGKVWVPKSGIEAGTGFLPNGDLVGCGGDTLIKVAPNGATTVLLGGLQYPNGLDVDLDGTIYVAEQNASRLRAVDPITGTFEVIGEGLTNANGVSFGPQYQSIYVGSFGAGKVWRFLRNGDGTWGDKEVYATLPPPPEPTKPAPKACDGVKFGGACLSLAGEAGACGGDPKTCEVSGEASDLFVGACAGKAVDESCAMKAYGQKFSGVCKAAGIWMYCDPSGTKLAACEGKAEGDGCVSLPLGYPTEGACQSGPSGLFCGPPAEGGGGSGPEGSGPLDGLNVDECGYVWVTQWIAGVVWRVSPDGTVGKAASLPSSWIPNMHWGSGIGGWESTVLYVMDRDEGRVFGLEVGLFGKEHTAPKSGGE